VDEATVPALIATMASMMSQVIVAATSSRTRRVSTARRCVDEAVGVAVSVGARQRRTWCDPVPVNARYSAARVYLGRQQQSDVLRHDLRS
jgi:hypothetical protein